jgi:quinol monooxygenase YgiN
MTLTVIATLKAQGGKEAQLAETLKALVGPTHAEQGCILYEMHRSEEDPGLFKFVEAWENRPLWEAHMQSPHLQAFSAQQDELVETWDLFVGGKVAG